MAQFPSFLEEVQILILTLPKHGITTMTLRPLHLGLIYWKEEIIMALHFENMDRSAMSEGGNLCSKHVME